MHAPLTYHTFTAACHAWDINHQHCLPAGQSNIIFVGVCLQVGTQLPVNLIQQNSTSLFACTPSIECEPQYAHLADGVVAIYAVDPTSKTVGLCTGDNTVSCQALSQCLHC